MQNRWWSSNMQNLKNGKMQFKLEWRFVHHAYTYNTYDWPTRLSISPLSCTVLSPLPLDRVERPGPPLHSHRVPPAPLQAMHSDRNGTGSCDTAWAAAHAPWVGPAVMCEEISAQRIFSCTCTADGRVQQHLLPRDLPLPETTTSPFLIYVCT